MENESDSEKKSDFLRAFKLFQTISELVIAALWLVCAGFLFIAASPAWNTAFKVCSVALLGISLFNAIALVCFSVLRRTHFRIGYFLALAFIILVAILSIALNLFVKGIRIQ